MQPINLHLQGGRYDAVNGLPAECLPALAALGALLQSVARDLFYHRNPDRDRVSPGFDGGLVPTITHVQGGGSADAHLVGVSSVTQEDQRALYDDAQVETLALLERAGGTVLEFPDYISLRTRRLLAEALRLVQRDELLEARVVDRGEATTGQVIRLHANARERVVAALEATPASAPQAFTLVGRLKGVQRDPWVLQLYWRESSRVLNLPVTAGVRDAALRVLVEDAEAMVWVSGLATRDADGRRTFQDADVLHRVAGPPLTPRLKALEALPAGWMDEEPDSRAPTRSTLRRAEQQIWALIEQLGCDRPYLFARPEGGVEALWRLGARQVVLRFGGPNAPVVGFGMGEPQDPLDRFEGTAQSEPFWAWVRRNLVVSR